MTRMTLAVVVLMLLFAGIANDAAAHHSSPTTYTGLSSWYGGPCDHMDNDQPYTGLPNTEPGIALYYLRPFKAFYLLTDSRGHRVVVRHSDKGPAPSTGKLVDLNWTAAAALGYPAPGGCVGGYPNGRVRITRLWHSRDVRRWVRRTSTRADDRWRNLYGFRTSRT